MSLEYQVETAEERAQRFKELKEAFAKGELPEKLGYESNDISCLAKAPYAYEHAYGVKIPQALTNEATDLFNLHLGQESKPFGIGSRGIYGSCSEDEIRANPQKYFEFFKKCEELERKLHQILLDKLNGERK